MLRLRRHVVSDNNLAIRRAIQTLRGGVVSRESVRLITVGTERVENDVSQSIGKLKQGNSKNEMLVIKADWGFGKSHFRMLLSDQLAQKEIPFTADAIDGRGSSLSHMHRAVWRWLEGVQIGRFIGLRAAVDQGAIDRTLIKEWSTRQGGSTFAQGIRRIFYGYECGWLIAMGHSFRTPDCGYQHDKALRCLIDCAEMLAAVGSGGIVLLLDEIENVDKQYDIRGRRKSYETLQILSSHPSVLPVVFVTDRFIRLIEEDRDQGIRDRWKNWQFLEREFFEEFSNRSHLSPPLLNEALARSLADKIVALYSAIHGQINSGFSAERVINFWKHTPTRSPRLLVRLLINELDLSSQR